MRIFRFSLPLVIGVALASCSSTPTASNGVESKQASKPSVVVSFYPLAFVADRLVGDIAKIVNLTPPGVEPHDLELSPGQADVIEDAKLVIAMGQGLQPSVEDAAKRRTDGVVLLLDRLGVKNPGDDKRADEIFDAESDPHVWLDPQLMQNVVAEIATDLAKVFPKSIDEINVRSTELGAELRGIDVAFAEGLAKCKGRVIITSHAAFGRLAQRYGLEQEAIVGISPEAEPTADRLASLADLVKVKNVKTIFSEELVSPKTAETLARETGVNVAVLSPIEGAPETGDYLSAMLKNLVTLREGLSC